MDYIAFQKDYLELIKTLPKKHRGALALAIAEYALEGVQPQLPGVAQKLFDHAIRPRVDAALSSSERVRTHRAGGGARRSRNATPPVSETGNENESENKEKIITSNEVIKKESAPTGRGGRLQEPPQGRFTPPTQAEVSAYCTGAALDVDARAFVAHYGRTGWRTGAGLPMADWQAAARGWHRSRHPPDGAGATTDGTGRDGRDGKGGGHGGHFVDGGRLHKVAVVSEA